MSDWIPIDAEPQPLTPTQQRIKELLDAGKKVYEIAWAVHMGKDFVIDEIYQIRKKESMQSMAKRLTDEQKKRIIQMRSEGKTLKEISIDVGCAEQSAANVWNAALFKKEYMEDAPKQEEQNAEPEQPEESATASEDPVPDSMPAPVILALSGRIHEIDDMVDNLQKSIEELTEEITALTDERYQIAEYMEGRI